MGSVSSGMTAGGVAWARMGAVAQGLAGLYGLRGRGGGRWEAGSGAQLRVRSPLAPCSPALSLDNAQLTGLAYTCLMHIVFKKPRQVHERVEASAKAVADKSKSAAGRSTMLLCLRDPSAMPLPVFTMSIIAPKVKLVSSGPRGPHGTSQHWARVQHRHRMGGAAGPCWGHAPAVFHNVHHRPKGQAGGWGHRTPQPGVGGWGAL